MKTFNSSLATIFSQPTKITLHTLKHINPPSTVLTYWKPKFFYKHVALGCGNCLCWFKRTTEFFKEVMGFVTTYPCNNSTRSPLRSYLNQTEQANWTYNAIFFTLVRVNATFVRRTRPLATWRGIRRQGPQVFLCPSLILLCPEKFVLNI